MRSGSSVRGVCTVLLVAVVGLSAATASAKRHPQKMGVSVVPSGQKLAVHISTSPGAKCALKVSAKRRSVMFTVWKVGRRGAATIKWNVPSDAPSGTWTFVATCVKGKSRAVARAKVVLINHGTGKGSLVSTSTAPGGKGGGNQSCAPIEAGGTGQVCFVNDPFATYQGGTDIGQCTWYAAGMRPDLDGITTGNAADWLTEAKGHKPEGTVPVVGSIAVNTTADGGVGHVAYVAGIADGGATLILDEANLHNNGGVFLNISTPASDFQGYIYGGPAGSGPGGGTGPGGPGPGGGSAVGSYPSIAVGGSGLPTVAAEGPDNSLYVYWETSDAQWHGPLGVGAGGSTFTRPSISANQSGLPTIAAQGPSNSLDVYWQTSDAQWHGPLGVGAGGSTFSAPSIAVGSSGLPTVAAEGPDNSLYVYWETSDAQWHGPLGVGAGGSTFSAPSIGANQSGLPTIAAQGPSNSLDVYWQTSDAQWHGPLGVGAGGSTFSAPSAAAGASGLPTVAAEGPSNSLDVYWETPDAQWHGPLGVGAGGSSYSAPGAASGLSGLPTIVAQGPSNSVDAYWQTSDAQWHGPLGIGGSF
jgi:surface antigen